MSNLFLKLWRGQTDSQVTEALISPSPGGSQSSNTPDIVLAHEQLAGPVEIGEQDIENQLETRYFKPDEVNCLKVLEKNRTAIVTLETELDKRMDEIDNFLLNAITLYLVMVGGGSLSEVLISKKIILYSLITVVALTFALAVGLTAVLAYRKLRKLRFQVSQVTAKRGGLLAEVNSLKKIVDKEDYGLENIFNGEEAITVSSGRARLTEILESLLPESGNYERDHMGFLLVTCVACLVYLGALVAWVLVLHAGGNVTVSKGRGPTMVVLYVWLCYLPAYTLPCAFLIRGVVRRFTD